MKRLHNSRRHSAKAAFLLAVITLSCAVSSQARAAKRVEKKAGGDIVFSARYYLKPNAKSRASKSWFHLYRINADGSEKRQITFGAHDDEFPLWTRDRRKIIWVRDYDNLMQSDENGRNMTKLQNLKGADWDGLKLSPDGKTVGFLQHISVAGAYKDVLRLLDLRTQKAVSIPDVTHYAWSSDNQFLALDGTENGFRVLDLRTRQTRKIKIENLGRFAWISPTDLVATIQKTATDGGLTSLDLGVESFQVFSATRVIQTFKAATDTDNYDELFDWRSFILPIPNATNTFTFVQNESTSSGYNATYFRVSTISGQMTRLCEGQSFAWSPNGLRFLNVTYHDTTPYDTLPNGHKRVVYTTKLQIGTTEKNLRDLVSGLVLVESADWRATIGGPRVWNGDNSARSNSTKEPGV